MRRRRRRGEAMLRRSPRRSSMRNRFKKMISSMRSTRFGCRALLMRTTTMKTSRRSTRSLILSSRQRLIPNFHYQRVNKIHINKILATKTFHKQSL